MRHVELLKKNYDFQIYAYRTKKKNHIQDVKNIYHINDAFNINADIAFIANPTYLHVETVILCLKAGIKNIFIEKPLSNTLKDLDYILKESKKKKAIIHIGYHMRYNPVMKRLKEIVDEKKNQIFYSETKCSSFLPDWRPEIDYRTIYSSKKDEGGGVILDISHEFDYNEWLLGKIHSIEGIYGKISNLEVDCEDFCDVILKFETNLIARIHLDFFSYNTERLIRILTPDEEIITDLLKNEIKIINNQGVKKESFNFEKDHVYEQQLKYFIEGVENQSHEISNLKDTIELLEKLLKFKKNNKMIMYSNKIKDY